MAKLPLQHFPAIDPSKEWLEGTVGWLSRYRQIGGWAASNLSLGWALEYVWEIEYFAYLAISAISGSACLFILRDSRIHRCKTDSEMHDLCHNIRDLAAKVLGQDGNGGDARSLFLAFNNGVAQDVADFFRVLCRDQSVTCAIRLAYKTEDGKNEYRTVGRSSGFEAIRQHQTLPVPADTGLPAKLRSAQCKGVFVIDDVEKAINSGDYFETPNDKLPDCRSMMVCPINGWENSTKQMTGILSISSRNRSAFIGWQTSPCKAISDILGLVYPGILAKIASDIEEKEKIAVEAAKKPRTRRAKGGT